VPARSAETRLTASGNRWTQVFSSSSWLIDMIEEASRLCSSARRALRRGRVRGRVRVYR
jgi:hypothetical protein